MTRPTAVRCPSEACGAEFEIATHRLGRSVHCPSCGVRMTARPLEIERRLREQQARIRGGPGAAIERLPFAVVLDNVRSLWNVGSMFRTADACGVQEMVLTGVTGCPPRPELAKTALGADGAVAWSYLVDPVVAVRRLAVEGFEPVALETTPQAVPLDRFEWPDRVALVVGNEVAGVGAPVLDACGRHLSLPMLGVKDSLNVAVAFGIAAFAAARSLRRRNEEAR